MAWEEMEKAMAFIVEQQAQTTVTVGRLSERVDALTVRVEALTENVDVLAVEVDKLATEVDRTAGSITHLLALAEIQAAGIKDLSESIRALADRRHESEERGRRTDERLNVLIDIVERHISEGRNGKG